MKKIYILSLALIASTFSIAQNDTLTSHMTGTPTMYTWSGGNGYVAGNNGYGDQAVVQLFDATYGVTGSGTINGVLLWVGYKFDNGGSYNVNIYDNNAGAIGSVIGTTTITLAATDTSTANLAVVGGISLYNVNAVFASPITIPGNNSFWVGVELPTTTSDTISLITSTDLDFTDATTHSGVISSGGVYYSYATDNIFIANAIFPYVTFSGGGAGVEENNNLVSVYPNPANDVLNFIFADNESDIVIIRDLEGRIVETANVNSAMNVSVNITTIAIGTYIYEVHNSEGVITSRDKFIKR